MGTWNEILSNWEYVLPPSRPSENEIARIKDFVIKYNTIQPVAIMGSTVEYRDLLYKLGFKNVYVFEKNIDFYNSLYSWKIFPCDNETLVKGDWRETFQNYKNFFNFILSDLTMGNICYYDRDKLYYSIRNSLKDNGVFIDKVLTNELPLITLDEIRKKYSNLPLNLKTANDFSCEALFCSELLNEKIIDTTQFYYRLEKEFFDDKCLLKFIEKSHLITPDNCIWYYGISWDELKNRYLNCFSDSIQYDVDKNSPYYGRAKHIFNYK